MRSIEAPNPPKNVRKYIQCCHNTFTEEEFWWHAYFEHPDRDVISDDPIKGSKLIVSWEV